MIAPHALTGLLTILITVLLLVGIWQVGSSAWIYVKADLAQVLLQQAWAGTLTSQQNVKPWPWADTWPAARLIVPSQGIDQIVLEGAYGRTLAFGPGRLESTGMAEPSKSIILTGHRDTHFRFLEYLKEGEEIRFQTRTGRWHRFTVRGHQIVDSRHASIHTDGDERILIFVTCYPFQTVRPNTTFRYVVTAIEEVQANTEQEGGEGLI